LLAFAGCALLFHFANAPLLRLVGQSWRWRIKAGDSDDVSLHHRRAGNRAGGLLDPTCALWGWALRGPDEKAHSTAALCTHISASGVAKGRWVVLLFRR
jgi:hypothetical protein